MLLEVAAGDETDLGQALDAVKAAQGVECSFRSPRERRALSGRWPFATSFGFLTQP
jgi:hypothetical protein